MSLAMSFIIKVVNTCNLTCSYCYLPTTQQVPIKIIPDEYIQKIITGTYTMGIKNVQFVWHGGEPLLAGLDFYKRIILLQHVYSKKWQTFDNVMQSNGILIDEEWVQFFKKNQFGVGISIDGHSIIHDQNRYSFGGIPTHSIVVNSFLQLKKYNCDGGICAVVNKDSLNYTKEIIEFFAALGVPELDFLPCFGSATNPKSYVKAITVDQYSDFMIDAFNYWIELDQPDFQIRFFRNIMIMLMGGSSNFCKFTPEKCSNFLAVNYNGDVYPCDNFVGIESWKLGSFAESDLSTILMNSQRRKFLRRMSCLDTDCKKCSWLQICWGGCTFHRYLVDSTLQSKSLFCNARKRIFSYIANVLNIEPHFIKKHALSLHHSCPTKQLTDTYLDVGRGCNSRCYFCAADSTDIVNVVSDAQITALKTCYQFGSTSLIISGGEPTLQAHLLEIVNTARKIGFTRIQLQSNGRQLSNVNYLKLIINAGITEFGLSLHGPDSVTHDKITGCASSFNQVIRGIENIRLLYGPNQPTAINCVITPENLTRLVDICELLLNLDVSTIKFAYLHGTGRANQLLRLGYWPKKTQVVPYILQAIQSIERLGRSYTTIAVEAIPPCLLPGFESYCSDNIIPPTLIINQDGTVNNFSTSSERIKRSECLICVWESNCLGPWKQYPQIFGWDEFIPIPVTFNEC